MMLVTVVVSHKPNILSTTTTTTTYKPTKCLNDNDYNYYYYYYSYYDNSTFTVNNQNHSNSKIRHRNHRVNTSGGGAGAIYNANADFIGIVEKLLVDNKSVILLKSMPTINCPLNFEFPHRKTFRRKALCQLNVVDDADDEGAPCRRAAQPNHSSHRAHPMLLMAHSLDCNAARTHPATPSPRPVVASVIFIMQLATAMQLIQTTTILITINFILYSYTLNRSLVDQPNRMIIKL